MRVPRCARDARAVAGSEYDGGMTDLVSAVNEAALARLSIDLGAAGTGGPLADSERRLVKAAERLAPTPPDVLSALRVAIRRGDDPLGDLFTEFRSPVERRSVGGDSCRLFQLRHPWLLLPTKQKRFIVMGAHLQVGGRPRRSDLTS